MGDWVEKGKGLRCTDWQLQKSRGDVKSRTGNLVSNITVTMYTARWVLEISRGTLYKVYDCVTTMLYT